MGRTVTRGTVVDAVDDDGILKLTLCGTSRTVDEDGDEVLGTGISRFGIVAGSASTLLARAFDRARVESSDVLVDIELDDDGDGIAPSPRRMRVDVDGQAIIRVERG